MNILVLNGSPRGNRSNTLKLTNAFLSGYQETSLANVEIIDVRNFHIDPCNGCFGCWTATPGQCPINDDMGTLLEKMRKAKIIIWSFPLYFFGMPSKLKNLLDRTLPHSLPLMEERSNGGTRHPERYPDWNPKHVLISTCGFCSKENNYEALEKQFDIMFAGNYVKVLCPEGELFSQPELVSTTNKYLTLVQKAGNEYAQNGRFTEKTESALNELLFPSKAFMQMADSHWQIKDENPTDSETDLKDTALRFTKQMAATYRPESFDGKERVIEFYYTDADLNVQLVMGQEECRVQVDGILPYTTRIETPYTVWYDISIGKYSGAQAMMDHKYKTFGSFDTMMNWSNYFYGGNANDDNPNTENGNAQETGKEKKSNMTIFILIWVVLWIGPPINTIVGSIIGISAALLFPLSAFFFRLTVFDRLSTVLVGGLSLLVLLTKNTQLIISASYFIFALLWLCSCFTKIPLTAHYSMNGYGGINALSNPLFIKTNFILTLCWGVLYVVTSIWTYFIMGSNLAPLVAIINQVCPLLLGIFTAWFQKWYPAHFAKNKT